MSDTSRLFSSTLQLRPRRENEASSSVLQRFLSRREASPPRIRAMRPDPNETIRDDDAQSEALHSILSFGDDESEPEEEIVRPHLDNPRSTLPSRSRAFEALFDDLFRSETARNPRRPSRFPGVTERHQTATAEPDRPSLRVNDVQEALKALNNIFESNGGAEVLLQNFEPEEDSGSPVGWAPIHYAAQKGSLNLVRTLLEKGADIDAADSNLRTPLIYAAQSGHLELCQFLIDKGANINVQAKQRVTPLLLAGLTGHKEIFELFLSKGADPEIRVDDGSTLLLLVVYHGSREKNKDLVEIARILLDHHSDPNAADNRGLTPLMAAAVWNGIEEAELLLAYGANVNVRGERGRSPLAYAAAEPDLAMVKLLLAHGADPTAVDDRGWTALHLCVQHDKDEVIDVARALLATIKIDTLNLQEEKGATALYLAVQSQRPEVVEALLQAGANPDIATKNDIRPLERAVMRQDMRLIDLLLHNGANINSVDNLGRSVLHIAVTQNNVAVVKRILKAGVDIELKTTDKRGVRALQLAVQNDNEEIAIALLEAGAQP